MAYFLRKPTKPKYFVKMNEYDPVYDDEDDEDEFDDYDDYWIDTTIYGEKPLGKLQISCTKQTL